MNKNRNNASRMPLMIMVEYIIWQQCPSVILFTAER